MHKSCSCNIFKYVHTAKQQNNVNSVVLNLSRERYRRWTHEVHFICIFSCRN